MNVLCTRYMLVAAKLSHIGVWQVTEGAAEEEAAKAKQGGPEAFAHADVVVSLGGWDENSAKRAAEVAFRALEDLVEAN